MVYPNIVVRNQFGEVQNEFIQGGSNQIDLNFVVDRTNVNGLGLKSLVASSLISAVYMNTNQSPAVGSPNPAAGFALIKFASPFQGYIESVTGFISALSGSNINITSGLTIGQAYVITSVGSSSAANWQALGLPTNIVPAVGVSFIATSASAGTGSGVVQLPASSGVASVEVVGNPNVSINPATGGGTMLVQFLKQAITMASYTPAGAITMASYTPAGVITNGTPDTFAGTPAVLTGTFAGTPAVLTGTAAPLIGAPADNSVVAIRLSFDSQTNAPLA